MGAGEARIVSLTWLNLPCQESLPQSYALPSPRWAWS